MQIVTTDDALSTQRCQMMRGLLIILLFIVSAHASAAADDAKGVALVSDGQAQAAIILADPPTPAARLAAVELQYAVEQMTGVSLPIYTAAKDIKPVTTRIYIGDQPATREQDLDPDSFEHNEYLCRVEPGRIVLFGKDAPTSSGRHINFNSLNARVDVLTVHLPGMYEPQGSLRAAYHFIESLGVRYYSPRDSVCVYPKTKTLVAELVDIRREPAIGYTNGLSNDNNGEVFWPIQRILYHQPSHEEVLLFARRMRTGGKHWAVVNHSLQGLRLRERFGPPPANPDNGTHEAYYPEIWPPAGSPAHQPCYSSPKLAELLAKDAGAYFDGKFDGKPYYVPFGGQDFFPIVPNDGYGFCDCEQCLASYKPYGDRLYPGVFGSGQYSDTFFGFLNQVAKPLAKSHPDKFIATLAYEAYLWPPKKIELEPNILVTPCIVTCDHWKALQRKGDWDAYDYWVKRANQLGHPIYLWNYFHHPEELGQLRGHKVFPQFSPKLIRTLAKRYARDKVDGVFLCGWGEGLDFYLLMKFFDNPDLDLNEVLDEYFTLSFGREAGSLVKQFYLQIEAISMRNMNEVVTVDERFFWEEQGDERTLQKLERLLDRAEKALPEDDTASAARFAAYRGLMNYMKQGRAEWLAKQAPAQ